MKRALAVLLLASLAACDRSSAANGAQPMAGAPKAEDIHDIDMLEFGNFEFLQGKPLPEKVSKWHGKRVRATGYMNPQKDTKGFSTFELVMNRASCCFGRRPQLNHFFQVVMAGGTMNYLSDPLTFEGRFEIDEQFDGDWQLSLYFLRDAKLLK